MFLAPTPREALRSFICTAQAWLAEPLPGDPMSKLWQMIELRDIAWPTKLQDNYQRIEFLFGGSRHSTPAGTDWNELEASSQRYAGNDNTSLHYLDSSEHPIEFSLHIRTGLPNLLGPKSEPTERRTTVQQLAFWKKRENQTDRDQPRDAIVKAYFLGLHVGDDAASTEIGQLIKAGASISYVIVDTNPGQKSIATKASYEQLQRALRYKLQKFRDATSNRRIVTVAMDNALVKASFLERPKTGGELDALLSPDIAGDLQRNLSARLEPFRIVYESAYRRDNMEHWRRNFSGGAASGRQRSDNWEIRYVDYDKFGFDVEAGEIARMPHVDEFGLVAISTLFGNLHNHVAEMIYMDGTKNRKASQVFGSRWRPYRSAAILISALAEPGADVVGPLTSNMIWFPIGES